MPFAFSNSVWMSKKFRLGVESGSDSVSIEEEL